jgi:hypothetical protein
MAGEKLGPGVYVAVRDLDGLHVRRAHQFLILVPKAPAFPGTKDLGDGTKGIVVGAHNVAQRLQVLEFQKADVQATREYLNSKAYGRPLRSFHFDSRPVRLSPKKGLDAVIREILRAITTYKHAEALRPISYPKFWQQGSAGCINSNSWAQSVIECVVGKGAVANDFSGWDLCKDNRIDRSYFK